MKTKLSLLLPALGTVFLTACTGPDVTYRPAPQILPRHIQKLAIRPVVNKTQQFGLEDKLTLRIRDEFLRNGQYAIVPESVADGVIIATINRYILTPVQYDTNLVPTVYKLNIILQLQFLDRTQNTLLWEEPNLEGIHTYPAATLAGGKTEEQAREAVWDILARDTARRVIEGFGAVTGASQRKISPKAPQNQPAPPPTTPINPNPY